MRGARGTPCSEAFRGAGLGSDLFLSAVNPRGPVIRAGASAQEALSAGLMRFATRAHPDRQVTLRDAVFSGLAPDGGLYHPVEAPRSVPS